MAEKKKYSDVDLSIYDSGYQASDAEKAAFNKKSNYESQVDNWSASPYAREDALQKVIDDRLNRKAFSYDLNADALYQQYKDQYITQGKQAMKDAMGQAAALTGGYASSYAATVGNQAYQGYLQGLNDKVPELYQLAMQRYNAEGNELDSKYNLLASEKASHMSEQEAALNLLLSQRDYYSGEAYNLHNIGYNEWSGNRDYDTTKYWNETNFGYQQDQDKIANGIAQQQLKLQQDAQKIAELQAGVVRDKNGKIVSVAQPVDEGYTLSNEQEERLFGYINEKNWAAADKYIEAMKANGMTDDQAAYWLQLIPESYFTLQGLRNNPFNNPFGPVQFIK